MPIDRNTFLITPLPRIDFDLDLDILRFSGLTGYDAVSDCFRFEVTALCEDPDIASTDLLGKDVTVVVNAVDGLNPNLRFFHGMVDEFSYEGIEEELFRYRLVLRPRLWLLSKTTDNRIFQNKSANSIVSELLEEHGVTDYEWQLSSSPAEREYCVQFGESDLDFIERLMEHEGIFYYFKFEETKHTLVFCDNPMDCPSPFGLSSIRFEPNILDVTEGEGVIAKLERIDRVVTGMHTMRDYNFENPTADLTTHDGKSRGHKGDAMEQYDYPGKYGDTWLGDELIKVRRQEDQATARTVWAESTAAMPASGQTFKLNDYPREVENIAYMIIQTDYEIWDTQYVAGSKTDYNGFFARYTMVPKGDSFRPERVAPKPVMKGPQTAIVVGPSGEEIYTDQYARVKVQFYWDREGGHNENSTCFIRVSSPWAGAGWGFIQIPRIGQEVIVDFLDGDPDRPIITGRVYNADQMPPYELPANMTQSGWKSDSSKGSGGFNELRFEDLKGEEEVYFQAEKDHTEWIKNNETRNIDNDFKETVGNDAKQDVIRHRDETVGKNKTTEVGVNRTVKIGNNDTETVGVNRSLKVGNNETIGIGVHSTENIGVNHTQTVGAVQTIAVGSARLDTVGTAETRTVGATQINTIGVTREMNVGVNQAHKVGSNDSWEVGANQAITIGGLQQLEVGDDRSVKVAKDSAAEIGENAAIKIGKDFQITVGKDLIIEAADSITLKCGKAAIVMKKDGTINIEGKDISVEGKGKINVKASSDVTMKGSKINQN